MSASSPPKMSSGDAQRRAWSVFGGDVEDLGEVDDGVHARHDAAVFVAADLTGVGTDLVGALGLEPAAFLGELLDPVAQGHHREASRFVLVEQV